MQTKCISVLLDNGIVSGAEIAEYVAIKKDDLWGGNKIQVEVHGYRKKVDPDNSQQKEIDAIVTIGRLIREDVIAAYNYSELQLEAIRRSPTVKAFNSLDGCHISRCPAPIERSRFRQTVNFIESISKGGKKDKKKGANVGHFNQTPFFEWLYRLDDCAVQDVLMHRKEIGLTDFEVESFHQIDWFKFICKRFGSPKDYPDAFHLWTAERNNIDVFLTLEKKLPSKVGQILREAHCKHQIRTAVLRPTALLQSMGISDLDEVPIKAGNFYKFLEGCKRK